MNPIDELRKRYTDKQLAMGAILSGLFFAALGFLTSKTSAAIKKAKTELIAWQNMTETDAQATPYLRKYWEAVSLPLQPASTAWSAAFISYVMGNLIRPKQSHIEYARAAYRDRQNKIRGKYWAYNPQEISKIKKGDILVRSRGDSSATWKDVTNPSGFHETHGDLVVETQKGGVVGLGGNKHNKVATEVYPLYGGKPPSNVFAVLRLA